MREQTKKLNDLLVEYKHLKHELFGDSMFVVPGRSNPKWDRYNQLLAFFYPSFRTKDFVSPI